MDGQNSLLAIDSVDVASVQLLQTLPSTWAAIERENLSQPGELAYQQLCDYGFVELHHSVTITLAPRHSWLRLLQPRNPKIYVFELGVSGKYDPEYLFQKLSFVLPADWESTMLEHAGITFDPFSHARLTIEGIETRVDPRPHALLELLRQRALHPRVPMSVQILSHGTTAQADDDRNTSGEQAVLAAAQANATVGDTTIHSHITTPAPVVNVTLQQTGLATDGDSGDEFGDKEKKIPEDETVLKVIHFVNEYRRKAKAGQEQQRSLKKIVTTFVGDGNKKEVDRLYRALKPDRFGWMLLPEGQ